MAKGCRPFGTRANHSLQKEGKGSIFTATLNMLRIGKIEKDEDYIRSIKNLNDTLEKCVKQNNAIDVFEEYFCGSYADHSSEPPSAKTLTVFR